MTKLYIFKIDNNVQMSRDRLYISMDQFCMTACKPVFVTFLKYYLTVVWKHAWQLATVMWNERERKARSTVIGYCTISNITVLCIHTNSYLI